MLLNRFCTSLCSVALALALLAASKFLLTPPQVHAEEIEVATKEVELQLKQVFPSAETFSVKEGRFPHHKAYGPDPETGKTTLLGFVFVTIEVEPEEWAYSSEIEMLVGMTTSGVITKVKMIDHYEPYGYFSIDPPEFLEQFEGKSILDPFEEGRDVDTVTRATITVEGAARVIKKAGRRIARQYLSKKQEQG